MDEGESRSRRTFVEQLLICVIRTMIGSRFFVDRFRAIEIMQEIIVQFVQRLLQSVHRILCRKSTSERAQLELIFRVRVPLKTRDDN